MLTKLCTMDIIYFPEQVLSVPHVTSGDLLLISATAAVEISVQAHSCPGEVSAHGAILSQ